MSICQRFHADTYIYDDLNLYFFLSLIGDANRLDRLENFIMEQIGPLLDQSDGQNSKLATTLKCIINVRQ